MTIATTLIWIFGILIYIILFGVIGGKICKSGICERKNYRYDEEDVSTMAVVWPFLALAIAARIVLHPLCWLIRKIASRVARRK